MAVGAVGALAPSSGGRCWRAVGHRRPGPRCRGGALDGYKVYILSNKTVALKPRRGNSSPVTFFSSMLAIKKKEGHFRLSRGARLMQPLPLLELTWPLIHVPSLPPLGFFEYPGFTKFCLGILSKEKCEVHAAVAKPLSKAVRV